MDWTGVDYCDVFISCLDSHSDGTHSLQRIHWWASDVMLHFSKSVQIKKWTHLHLGWPEGEYICIFGQSVPLKHNLLSWVITKLLSRWVSLAQGVFYWRVSSSLTACSWQICVSLSSCSSLTALVFSYCWISISISTFTCSTYATEEKQNSRVKVYLFCLVDPLRYSHPFWAKFGVGKFLFLKEISHAHQSSIYLIWSKNSNITVKYYQNLK